MMTREVYFMGRYAGGVESFRLSSSIAGALKTEGLPFQDVFTSAEISGVIDRVVPEWRDRVFSP